MATPLGELLRQLRTDTDTQIHFHRSPAEYLHEHGWGDLDPADMQEAMLLLADAAPAAEAAGWIVAGDAIDPDSTETADALESAIGTLQGLDGVGDDVAGLTDLGDDVDDLDEFDGLGESDPGDLDGLAAVDDIETTVEAAGPTVETAGEPPVPIETDIEIDALDLDADVDPTDTPSPTDTPPTEDLTGLADLDADLDPDPDWDDPS